MIILNRVDRILESIEKGLIVLLFTALIFLISFNIFTRNFFHTTFTFVPKVSPTIVLWLALLGSTLALKANRHIRLEILLKFCSDHVKYYARILAGLFSITVMGILFFASFSFMKTEIGYSGFSGIYWSVFPLFFLLILFRNVVAIINIMHFLKKQKNSKRTA